MANKKEIMKKFKFDFEMGLFQTYYIQSRYFKTSLEFNIIFDRYIEIDDLIKLVDLSIIMSKTFKFSSNVILQNNININDKFYEINSISHNFELLAILGVNDIRDALIFFAIEEKSKLAFFKIYLGKCSNSPYANELPDYLKEYLYNE